MRSAFINSLMGIAKKDPSVILMTGDLGFTVFEPFREAFPNQFINAGVAEQNMIGVATGLALSGKKVFAYSIIPFATFRCLEQVRDDVCYHNANVCVVGVGSGYSYGHMGSTHHALEDISVLRSLPNMTVTCPGDPIETQGLVEAIYASSGPHYLRLGKAGEPMVHEDVPEVTIGKSIQILQGKDITIIASGTMLHTAKMAALDLQKKNVSVSLISMHTIKPLDTAAVLKAAESSLFIVTVEEHSKIGGLGSAVAECLATSGFSCRLHMCAAPDHFAEDVGSQAYFREKAGLTPDIISATIYSMLPFPIKKKSKQSDSTLLIS